MIIGLTGCKGVGKDTAGQFLVDHCEFTRVAFTDKLKEAVANLWDIPLDQVDYLKNIDEKWLTEITSHSEMRVFAQLSWREFLQRFGTEMGRNTFGQDFWVNLLLWSPDFSLDKNIVITDVRFANEADRIKSEAGGRIIEITRPGYEPDGHSSEEPLSSKLIDAKIINSGAIEDLEIDIYDLYKELSRVNV